MLVFRLPLGRREFSRTGKDRARILSATSAHPGSYNDESFRPPWPERIREAAAAWERVCGREARATLPEGTGGNASASRASVRAHWKGNEPAGNPPSRSSFHTSIQQSAL